MIHRWSVLIRPASRILLAIPPLLLAAAAIELASTSPWNWSSDSPPLRSLPYWVSSLSPFIVASLPLAFGIGTTIAVVRHSRGRFGVEPVLLISATIAMLFVSLLLSMLAEQDAYGRFQYPTEFGGGNAAMSLVVTVMASAVFMGSASAFAYLYGKSVVPEGSTRFERRKDEPDGMGILIERMQARRGPRSSGG